MSSISLRCALIAATLAVPAVASAATNFTLKLTAAPPKFLSKDTSHGLVFGLYSTTTASGLDSTNPITVRNGDTITATVTFAPLIKSGADDLLRYDFFYLNLTPGEPGLCCGLTSHMVFYDAGKQVFEADSGTGDGSIFTGAFIPKGLAFDSLTAEITLPPPYPVYGATFDQATIGEDTISATPEPATWAMMLIGIAGIGGAMRRKAPVSISYDV